jgi:hypothetical protein
MHPGDHSGHVIDLGVDLAAAQLSTQSPSISCKDEAIEINEQQIFSTNANKIQAKNENGYQFYQQVFS